MLFLRAFPLVFALVTAADVPLIDEEDADSLFEVSFLLSPHPSYDVRVDGEAVLGGRAVSVQLNGKSCAASNGCLSPVRSVPDIIKGTDRTLGVYSGASVQWIADGNVPVVTAVKIFANSSAVVFETFFPQGANGTSCDDVEASSINFPAFQQNQYASALSWQGSFTQSVRGFSQGRRGGPTVFYGSEQKSILIGSPLDNFKSSTAGSGSCCNGTKAWAPGTAGTVKNFPVGFRQRVILRLDMSGSITHAISEWGKLLRASRFPDDAAFFKTPDVTVQKVGYQTDNGAMYCFCRDKNCSATLIEKMNELKDGGAPMGYLSFQGAGASDGRGQAAPWCVSQWGVDGGLGPEYPLSVDSLHGALGNLPLQLYAPYFCPDNVYFGKTQPDGSKWKALTSNMSIDGCNGYAFQDVVPDESRKFYDWFFEKGVNAGMTSFEPDFMNQNYNCVDEFIGSVDAGKKWQRGMADAALDRNVTVQWCYAAPSDILSAIDFPAVTNFRVSLDFCYGRSWDIGESSLLVWAAGGYPSKDTLWTTSNNKTAIPGCDWTPDHEDVAAPLHVVLALMSTGPVGISDAIGYTNFTLLKRVMNAGGVLLKPSKPVTSVDSTFYGRAPPGYVYSTFSMGGKAYYFVSFKLTSVWQLPRSDFFPLISSASAKLVYRNFGDGDGCVNGSTSGCIDVAGNGAHVATLPASDTSNVTGGTDFAPTVTTFWTVDDSCGWLLLGELGKYVALSDARFSSVKCGSYTLKGEPGEVVVITYSELGKGSAYTAHVRQVRIGNDGLTRVVYN